jgi:ABC-2 type transport system ATP-binding protein
MRQKLAICCAYLHDPAALLLDEPMTGLDPPGIRNLKQSIREHAARGAAVIISSHLLAMVEDICTHVLIIDRGKMKFFGSLEEIKAQVRLSEQENGHSSLEDVFFAALDCQMEIRSAIGGSATSTDVESVTAS